jgi:hypothetical protein
VFRTWSVQRWRVAGLASGVTVLLVGVPTVLIPNPWFGRTVAPTWWAWPVLLMTSLLSGLITATYVASPTDATAKSGALGGFLSFLAVGCPACNKIALLALGASGAVRWFAPVQPLLALVGIALLAYALRRRLVGELNCELPVPDTT